MAKKKELLQLMNLVQVITEWLHPMSSMIIMKNLRNNHKVNLQMLIKLLISQAPRWRILRIIKKLRLAQMKFRMINQSLKKKFKIMIRKISQNQSQRKNNLSLNQTNKMLNPKLRLNNPSQNLKRSNLSLSRKKKPLH